MVKETKRLTLSMPMEVFEVLEGLRGDIPRSTYIQLMITKELLEAGGEVVIKG